MASCPHCKESLDAVQPASGEALKWCYWCGAPLAGQDRSAEYALALKNLAAAAADQKKKAESGS